MEVYVARQPIFNKKKKIYGYELLFRDGTANFFSGIDGNTATSKVLSNSFFTIGIEKITGNKLAFVNFTRDLLIRHVPMLFPNHIMVVEVLEDVEPEENVIAVCREISAEGYHIALDDFFFRSEMEPLVAIANTIKIDFRATSIEEIEEYIQKLSRNNLYFLAEKVETYEEFQRALAMGFHYFQGYFFSRPEVLTGQDISSAQMNLLEIMAEVNKEDFEFRKIEKIIERDVAISYKLLRYMNSAYFRRVNEIYSINQAIVLLGENGIRSFLSLIAMSKLASDKPDELVRSSIIRAKFCELVGKMSRTAVNPSELFTLGLFSSIDAILNDTMENLMAKLPLSEALKKALIHGEGDLNDYLRLAVSYERGDWADVSDLEEAMNLDKKDLPTCYMEALNWADAFTSI
ncbi:MAG: HDOD domain-containing protein [Deltaproteobacteria bacterium]|nr:HDOD domain-containing protein [Deltaproteobacteria bacterium]